VRYQGRDLPPGDWVEKSERDGEIGRYELGKISRGTGRFGNVVEGFHMRILAEKGMLESWPQAVVENHLPGTLGLTGNQKKSRVRGQSLTEVCV
jgi:hypothetical protein